MNKEKKGPPDGHQKTPEEIAALRKAKKAEKAAKKNQPKSAPAESKNEPSKPTLEKMNAQTPVENMSSPPEATTEPSTSEALHQEKGLLM